MLNVNLLKGKQKENLIASKEQLKLSKKLVTIPLDVPVELDVESMERKEPDRELLKKVFEELEFKTMASQILGTQPQVETQSEEGATTAEVIENEDRITSYNVCYTKLLRCWAKE